MGRCLDDDACPLEPEVVDNLRFVIGLRNEIEHQMTTRIADLLSARFQACCINYHEAAVALFGDEHGVARYLSFSLQFSALTREQADTLDTYSTLPAHIKKYIAGFDGELAATTFQSTKFAYRVIFVPKTVNSPNQADQVITFMPADSELAQTVNAQYAVIRETERPKRLPSEIVALMRQEGFPRFGMQRHIDLWKSRDAKREGLGYGVQIAGLWYWYDSWVEQVRQHCRENAALYG